MFLFSLFFPRDILVHFPFQCDINIFSCFLREVTSFRFISRDVSLFCIYNCFIQRDVSMFCVYAFFTQRDASMFYPKGCKQLLVSPPPFPWSMTLGTQCPSSAWSNRWVTLKWLNSFFMRIQVKNVSCSVSDGNRLAQRFSFWCKQHSLDTMGMLRWNMKLYITWK